MSRVRFATGTRASERTGGSCHGNAIRLFNADGSEAEISGNGTRCAAALLVNAGLAAEDVFVKTGAGLKHLRLIERQGRRFLFEMNMGLPRWREDELRHNLSLSSGPVEVTVLDVGNPQCAMLVEEIPGNWRELGAEIEGHLFFPKRTNVSFVQVLDPHTVEARFYERGAGATLAHLGNGIDRRRICRNPAPCRQQSGARCHRGRRSESPLG